MEPTLQESRIPHGMRGLKFGKRQYDELKEQSHPAWDAWIEIGSSPFIKPAVPVSHPAWDAWIEINFVLI